MSAKAVAIFEGDDAKLQKTLKHIEQSLLSVEERFARVHEFSLNVLEAIGLLTVAEKAFEGLKSVLEVGVHLNALSQQTGVAVGDLAIMEQQFKQAGVDAGSLAGAVGAMQAKLATGEGLGVLEQMGVSLDELRQKAPREQFEEMGAAINRIKGPTDRAAAAVALFGKHGRDLLPVFASHAFEEAADRVGAQAKILNEDAGFFAAAGDKLGLAGLKTQGFFVGVADRVVPVLLPLLDRFEKFDAAKSGQHVGDVINSFIAGENPFEHWLDDELAGITGVLKFISDALYSGFLDAGSALIGTGETFVSILLNGVAAMLDDIAKAPGLGWLHGAARGVRGEAQSFSDASKANAADIGWLESPVHDMFDNIIGTLGKNITKETDDALARAATMRHDAQAKHPTNQPGEGYGELNFGDAVSVTSLGRVGGEDYAGTGDDPLLAAHKETNTILRDIHKAVSEPKTAGHGGHPIYQ